MTDDKRKYTKEEKKTIKPSKEMSSAEDGNTYHKREKNDKAIGSLDTFITQAIKEPSPPQSYKQESREQGSSSSKELDV